MSQVNPKTILTFERLDGVQFTEDSGPKLADWCGGTFHRFRDDYDGEVQFVFFESFGSKGYVTLDDWVVRDEDGNYYGYSNQELQEQFTIAGWHKE